MGGIFFVEAEEGKRGKFTYCDDRDLKRILAEIEVAKKETPNVIICVHSHQIKHGDYFEPDYFLEEFAHKCIEHGVIAIIGGGTHQLKPIEIYEGKPIFYSLGNFVFQLDKVSVLPADFWDKYDYDVNNSIPECLAIKTKGGTIGLEVDKSNYVSILPLIQYKDCRLNSISIIPIELNFSNSNKLLKRLPRIAPKEEAREVFDILSRISKPYGTSFKINNNNIIEINIE